MVVLNTPVIIGSSNSLQSLATGNTADGDVAIAEGYRRAGDGGGREFYYQASPPPSASITDSMAQTVTIASIAAMQTAVIQSISDATNAIVTTVGAHPFLTGQRVLLFGTGSTNGIGVLWTVTRLTSTEFQINNAGWGLGAASSGLAVAPEMIVTSTAPYPFVSNQAVYISETRTQADGHDFLITNVDSTHFILNGSEAPWTSAAADTATSVIITTPSLRLSRIRHLSSRAPVRRTPRSRSHFQVQLGQQGSNTRRMKVNRGQARSQPGRSDFFDESLFGEARYLLKFPGAV